MRPIMIILMLLRDPLSSRRGRCAMPTEFYIHIIFLINYLYKTFPFLYKCNNNYNKLDYSYTNINTNIGSTFLCLILNYFSLRKKTMIHISVILI